MKKNRAYIKTQNTNDYKRLRNSFHEEREGEVWVRGWKNIKPYTLNVEANFEQTLKHFNARVFILWLSILFFPSMNFFFPANKQNTEAENP